MAEILFQGKRKDNGEWIEGDVFHNHDGRVFIGELVVTDYTGSAADQYELGIAFTEVLPETVGQYIGRTDKNGKKIFEGNIVRCFYQTWFTDYSLSYVVEWNKKKLCCSLHMPSSEVRKNISEDEHYACEIVGNIYDNPELLKG